MYGARVQFLVQSQMPLGTPKNKTLLNMIQIWKCDKYLQSGGIPAFIPQILTQTGPGGRLLAWEGVGGGRDRAAPHARPRLHPPGVSLSPHVPAPLFLPPTSPPLPFFSPLLPPPRHAPCFGAGCGRSSRGHLPEVGDCTVLASPRFWEKPWRRAVRTGTVTPGRVCGFSPGAGSQAPESKEEPSPRVGAPPPSVVRPDSGLAGERARPRALGGREKAEGPGSTRTLAQRASPGAVPQVTHLLTTAEARLVKHSSIMEVT